MHEEAERENKDEEKKKSKEEAKNVATQQRKSAQPIYPISDMDQSIFFPPSLINHVSPISKISS